MSSFERRLELGEHLRQAIDQARGDIIQVCKEIYSHPEPGYQEELASSLLTDLLASYGFGIESGIAEFSTAFHGYANNLDREAMRKGLQHGHVAFLAEYDSPAGQQHVAGKHLTAGGAVAAGIGLAATLTSIRGTVAVFGCPASEDAGKSKMTADGCFDEVDAAFGVVPRAPGEGFQPTINTTGETLASVVLMIRYEDEHASALQDLQTAVQSVLSDLEAPAKVENLENGIGIVALEAGQVEAIAAQIRALAEARATSSGIPVQIETGPLLKDMNVMRVLARRTKTFGDNLKSFHQDNIVKQQPGAPTDWGNVSYVTPTSRTYFSFSDSPVAPYDPDFAALSNTPEAYDQMIEAAKATALTGLDLLGDIEFRGFSEGEFIRGLQARGIQRVPRRWTGVHPVYPRNADQQTSYRRPKPGGIVRGPGLPPDTEPDK